MALIFSFSFLLMDVSAETTDFHKAVYLGEFNSKDYKGPLSPEHKFNQTTGRLNFVDDIFMRDYLNQETEPHIFILSRELLEEFPAQSLCPNSYLDKNVNYMRYLFRLLAISYLLEGVKDYYMTMTTLGNDVKNCSIRFNHVFGKCNPKSEDMKLFLKRVKHRYMQDFNENSMTRMGKKERSDWLENLHKMGFAAISRGDMSRVRVWEWCDENFYNCKSISLDKVSDILDASCEQDKKLIENICSEEDSLYGLSYMREPVELLLESNIMTVINEGGFGRACLERYVKLFYQKERLYKQFDKLFVTIRNKIKLEKKRYAQGDFFIPGALREFDEKGLNDFLFVAPTPTPVVVPTPIPVPTPKPTPKPTPVATPVPRATPTPRPTPIPVPTPAPSQFEMAVAKLRENDKLNEVRIDMKLFEKDFVFTPKMQAKLENPLKTFQTREALNDMKTLDGLGTRKQPVSLIFLKFLIDQNGHQGLWNIVSVIGNRFYVVNDIEKKKDGVLVKLHNDETTDYQWQITMVRHLKPEAEKKPEATKKRIKE